MDRSGCGVGSGFLFKLPPQSAGPFPFVVISIIQFKECEGSLSSHHAIKIRARTVNQTNIGE
jgi:hypothetical protein